VTAPERVLASSDCEALREGWITQPANTISSLAYVGVGVGLVHEARHRPPDQRRAACTAAVALAAVGLGSVAYHGPGGVLGRRLHDASIVAATGFLALGDLQRVRRRPRPGPRELAALAGLALGSTGPRTSAPAQAMAGGLAVVADGAAWWTDPTGSRARRLRTGATALWLLGGTAQGTGRTGGPACRPDGRLQVHAGWHLLSALALGLTARAQLEPVADADGRTLPAPPTAAAR
jgi:hypothetical protein